MGETSQSEFKPGPRHLLPVTLGLIVTGILAYPLSSKSVPTAQVTPFAGDSVSNASFNAIIFVLALALSATAMVFIIRKGRMRLIRRMIKFALVIVSFAVTFWYATSIFFLSGSPLPDPLATILLVSASIGIGAVIGLLVFGKRKTGQLVGVTLVGPLTGIFLGYSIGLTTTIVLVVALIIYDIVAVFRGPVGALAKSLGPSDLPGAMFNYGELSIGMGDLVFYSLVATTALVYLGFLPFVFSAIGILAGSYLGFRALSKYEMFPGLPFSLALGTVGMFLAFWLQTL